MKKTVGTSDTLDLRNHLLAIEEGGLRLLLNKPS